MKSLAQKMFLDLLVAYELPEQEPEHIAARWYHMLWLLVPICGFILFIQAIQNKYYHDQSI
jgi:beta-lactamase regulating signal transducer with metallopeptidase domain